MLCAVYKSRKKDSTYLYVKQRDDFSAVPQALLDTFGKREHLALADIDRVKQQLQQQGFYLQLPPPPEDLLAQHKALQR
jgi:uncharacterized protein YcgL (UPF0745 family)